MHFSSSISDQYILAIGNTAAYNCCWFKVHCILEEGDQPHGMSSPDGALLRLLEAILVFYQADNSWGNMVSDRTNGSHSDVPIVKPPSV